MSNKTEPLHAYRMRETEDDDWKVVIAEDLVRAVEIWHHHHAQDDPFSVEHLDCEVLTKYSDLDDDENSAFTGE